MLGKFRLYHSSRECPSLTRGRKGKQLKRAPCLLNSCVSGTMPLLLTFLVRSSLVFGSLDGRCWRRRDPKGKSRCNTIRAVVIGHALRGGTESTVKSREGGREPSRIWKEWREVEEIVREERDGGREGGGRRAEGGSRR
ncbi:hypothetical protein Tco_0876502 [Tanacetum coccineum]|uniref:Uncharacterized protein n=1 Tax=Tanacetum coccineum TaxID=301880 RepID=A0ABQ5BSE0_9ASTR